MRVGDTAETGLPAIGLHDDFRNPARRRRPRGDLHRAVIDQVAWIGRVRIGTGDPFTAAGARERSNR